MHGSHSLSLGYQWWRECSLQPKFEWRGQDASFCQWKDRPRPLSS